MYRPLVYRRLFIYLLIYLLGFCLTCHLCPSDFVPIITNRMLIIFMFQTRGKKRALCQVSL